MNLYLFFSHVTKYKKDIVEEMLSFISYSLKMKSLKENPIPSKVRSTHLDQRGLLVCGSTKIGKSTLVKYLASRLHADYLIHSEIVNCKPHKGKYLFHIENTNSCN